MELGGSNFRTSLYFLNGLATFEGVVFHWHFKLLEKQLKVGLKISLKLFNMKGELLGEGINRIETSGLAQAPYLIKAFKKGELISKQLIFKK